MKDLWVLSIQTSLPYKCYNHEELNKSFFVFDSFEKARDTMLHELHNLAFNKNTMFDGTGRLKMLNKSHLYDKDIDETDFDEKFLGPTTLNEAQDILISIYNGEKVHHKLRCGTYSDGWSTKLKLSSNAFRVFGFDEGPENGIDPIISTNMFDTSVEQDYYLYIDDAFGQDDYSSELYIDLKKVEMDG